MLALRPTSARLRPSGETYAALPDATRRGARVGARVPHRLRLHHDWKRILDGYGECDARYHRDADAPPAPTPTNVPAGWSVLDTTHFSLAYPPGWTTQASPQPDGSILYRIVSPEAQAPAMLVGAQALVPSQNIEASYCMTGIGANQPTTLAGLPMAYNLTGEGQLNRTWTFANTQSTIYGLEADDVQASSATQAQDTSIFATFRPDDADPWKC